MLKELALNAPTFFFQQVQPFFENIPNAVRDPKVSFVLYEIFWAIVCVHCKLVSTTLII